jgi:hypothetical protein
VVKDRAQQAREQTKAAITSTRRRTRSARPTRRDARPIVNPPPTKAKRQPPNSSVALVRACALTPKRTWTKS